MNQPEVNRPSMPVRSALGVLAEQRDASTIVVTHQGSARVWPHIANHPLDFHYNPSTMGGAIPFGVGLALARPALHVVVISGDGSLTMNLGSLITAAALQAANLTVVVLDNGIYEVTGGQRTAALNANVDYVALATSVGFPSASNYVHELAWRQAAPTALAAAGPRFISLCVEPALPADMNTTLPPLEHRLADFHQALAATE